MLGPQVLEQESSAGAVAELPREEETDAESDGGRKGEAGAIDGVGEEAERDGRPAGDGGESGPTVSPAEKEPQGDNSGGPASGQPGPDDAEGRADETFDGAQPDGAEGGADGTSDGAQPNGTGGDKPLGEDADQHAERLQQYLEAQRAGRAQAVAASRNVVDVDAVCAAPIQPVCPTLPIFPIALGGGVAEPPQEEEAEADPLDGLLVQPVGVVGVQRRAARKRKRKDAKAGTPTKRKRKGTKEGTPTVEQGGEVSEPPHEEEAKADPKGGVPERPAKDKRGTARKGKRKGATAPAEPAGVLAFKPPRSKSSGERKSCICGWGDDCARLKTFFDSVDHVLSGSTTEISFSGSCNFQNFWRATCASTALGVPAETKAAFEKRFRETEGDKVERKKIRLRIARHHFPPEVLSAKLPLLAPITKDTMESLGCYKGMTPSALEEAVPRYDTELGDGQSQRGRKRGHGRELHVIAPCATLDSATSIAAMVQNGGDGGRASVDEIRAADEKRTPEEWRALLRNAAAARDAEVGALREDNARLMGLLMKKDDLLVRKEATLVEARKNVARKRRRLERTEASLVEEKNINEGQLAEGKRLMRRRWRSLLEGSGGLSRLTMFEAAWHEKHPLAARLLWGFKTLEEAKQRVMELFPEVDTERHATLRVREENKKGELTIPPITEFEKCLITRMYCRLESNQGVVALMVGCHRTRLGQILKEWAPRWAAAGDEHARLDIEKREKMLGRKRRNEDPDQFEPLDSLLHH